MVISTRILHGTHALAQSCMLSDTVEAQPWMWAGSELENMDRHDGGQ